MAYDLFDPLGEGANRIGQEEQDPLESQVLSMLDVLEDSVRTNVERDRDFSSLYNTDLGDREDEYQSWLQKLSEQEKRDVSKDNYDYDTRGLFLELDGQLPKPGHGPDTYKKPNHPTFSIESKYNEQGGYRGGMWRDGEFVVGPDNFYRNDELQDYFSRTESGTSLRDDRGRMTQTEQLAAKLGNEDFGYSYVKSDLEAMQAAQLKGDRGIGEILKEKFDPRGDNVIGRVFATIGGSMLGGTMGARIGGLIGSAGGLAGTAIGTAAGWILGTIGTIIGGMAGDAGALWVSEKDERDIREDMLRLDAGEFKDDAEREEAKKRVADWYNEKNIEQYRDQGFLATVVDITLESLPYMASFIAPGKFVAGQVTRKGAALRTAMQAKGAENALEAGGLGITKQQSKSILRNADRLIAADPSWDRAKLIGTMMEHAFARNAARFLSSKAMRIGYQGTATLAIQQPKLFSDLRQEQLDGITVQDGKFKLDESVLQPGSIARKEALAYTSVLVETVGYEMASKLVKATGIPSALAPLVEKIVGSKPAKMLGEKGIATSAKKFLDETTLGKSLKGKTKLMGELHDRWQLGGTVEEWSEEYIEGVTQAVMGLDKDDREKQGMSYAQNLVDKVLFPVTHPVESAAMLVSFAIFPTAAAAASALRGDTPEGAFKKFNQDIEKAYRLRSGRSDTVVEGGDAERVFKGMEDFASYVYGKDAGKPKWFVSFMNFMFGYSNTDRVSEKGFGRSVKGLVSAIDTQVEAIAKETGLEKNSDEVISLAVREVVSQHFTGRIYETLAGRDQARELIRSGDISKAVIANMQGEVAIPSYAGRAVELGGGRKGYGYIYELDAGRAAELSKNKQVKALIKSGGVVRKVNESTAAKINQSESKSISTGVFTALANAVQSKDADAIANLKKKAVDHLLKQTGAAVLIRNGLAGQSSAQQRKAAEATVDQITAEIARNPGVKLVAVPAEILVPESSGKGMDTTGRTGARQVIEAFNLQSNNTIYVNQFASANSAARVIEEEALELSHKTKTGGIGLTRPAARAMDLLRGSINKALEREDLSEGHRKSLQRALKIIQSSNMDKANFEAFIAAFQSIFGMQKQNAPKSLQNALEAIGESGLTEVRKAFASSVEASFTPEMATSIKAQMNEVEAKASESGAAEEREYRKNAGKEAVKDFLGGKGRSSRQRRKAAETLRQRLDSGEIEDDEGQALARIALVELERPVPKGRKQYRKVKRALRILNESYPDISYSAQPVDQTVDEDYEEASDGDGIDREKPVLERGRGIYLINRLLEIYHQREGSRMIMQLGRGSFMERVAKSRSAWQQFLAEDPETGSFLEREVRRIANESHLRINRKTKAESSGPITFEEIQAFIRYRSSLHVYQNFMFRPRTGELWNQNQDNVHDEIVANMQDILDDEAVHVEIFDHLRRAYDGSMDDRYDFLGRLLGLPGGMLKDIDFRIRGTKLIDEVFNRSLIAMLDAYENWEKLGKANKEATATNIVKSIGRAILVSRKEYIEKKYTPKKGKVYSKREAKTKYLFINKLLDELGFEERLAANYTNVASKSSSAIIGDAHIISIFERILDSLGLEGDDRIEAVSFLDGLDWELSYESRRRNPTADMLEGDELEKTIHSIFNKSVDTLKDKGFYMHHLGRFGEKGSMPFIWQRFYGRTVEELEEHVQRVSEELGRMSKPVADMFVDPAKLLAEAKVDNGGKIDAHDLAMIHYAINGFDLAPMVHGNLDAYIKSKGENAELNAALNVLNVVARASQELTDGIAFDGSLNLVLLEDVPSIILDSGKKPMNAFDGQAILMDHKAREIAWFYGPELMGGAESADSFKGHISTSPDARTLVKVNWHNAAMLAETAPELKKIINWLKNHPEVDGVVFGSGAKFSDMEVSTVGEKPKPKMYGPGSLIRSQELGSDNDITHEGLQARQRAAHMQALHGNLEFQGRSYESPGRTAARLRAAVSRKRRDEKLPAKLKEERQIGDKAPPEIKRARDNGESVYDPRYTSHVIKQMFAAIVKTLRPSGPRVALQKIGEGGLGLKGYVLLDAEGNVTDDPDNAAMVRMPRANMNIVGARYELTGFRSREEAVGFIQGNRSLFLDMFWPNAQGFAGADVMEHEITQETDGSWTIPGDLVEETRIPSGAYSSHSFLRLKNPATPGFESNNISITPEGIRVAKGEDFDGDKGFVLMFKKKIDPRIKNGMFEEIKDENGRVTGIRKVEAAPGQVLVYNLYVRMSDTDPSSTALVRTDSKESEDSMMNRAFNLERVAWMHPDTYRMYAVTGDVPKDAFDKALVNAAKQNSKILPKLKLNSIEGIATASTINRVRQQTIGIAAVYNSMYSIMATSGETLKLDGMNNPKINPQLGQINLPQYGIAVKTEIAFDAYNSVKRIIDLLLNMALDDHKDPRLHFLNLNKETAGIGIFLMMQNVAENNIPLDNDRISGSKAFVQAANVLRFLSSPAVKAYVALRRNNSDPRVPAFSKHAKPDRMKDELKRLLAEDGVVITDEVSAEISAIIALHQIQSRMFDFTSIVKSAYKTVDGLEGFIDLMNAWISAGTGFDGLFNKEQTLRLFTSGSAEVNPAMELASNVFQELGKALGSTPILNAINRAFPSLRYDLQNEDFQAWILKHIRHASTGLVLSSIRGEIADSDYKDVMVGRAAQIIKSGAGSNPLLKHLEVAKKGGKRKITLTKSYRTRDLTVDQVERMRAAFAELPIADQETLAVAAYVMYGLNSSNWTGSWAMFMPDELSARINKGISGAVASVNNGADYIKLIEAGMYEGEIKLPEGMNESGVFEEPEYGELQAPMQQLEAPQAPEEPTMSAVGLTTQTVGDASRAEAMEREGMSKHQIFYDTGWYRGLDGEWRFEISDIKAKNKLAGLGVLRLGDATPEFTDQDGNPRALPLEQLLDHPQLFAAYPELRQFPVHLDTDMRSSYGSFEGDHLRVRGDAGGKAFTDVLLHEIQHWIQSREGWAPGSSPAAERFDVDTDLAARNRYLLSAGEMEARNTVYRNSLTAMERHLRKPWETLKDMLVEEGLMSVDQNPEDVARVYNTAPGSIEITPQAVAKRVEENFDDLPTFSVSILQKDMPLLFHTTEAIIKGGFNWEFVSGRKGVGEGFTAYSPGFYFAEHPEVRRYYISTAVQRAGVAHVYAMRVNKDTTWLDWEKPTDPKIIKRVIEKLDAFSLVESEDSQSVLVFNNSEGSTYELILTGEELFNVVASDFADGQVEPDEAGIMASRFLAELGITGMRTKAGLQRRQDRTYYNYVFYDEKAIDLAYVGIADASNAASAELEYLERQNIMLREDIRKIESGELDETAEMHKNRIISRFDDYLTKEISYVEVGSFETKRLYPKTGEEYFNTLVDLLKRGKTFKLSAMPGAMDDFGWWSNAMRKINQLDRLKQVLSENEAEMALIAKDVITGEEAVLLVEAFTDDAVDITFSSASLTDALASMETPRLPLLTPSFMRSLTAKQTVDDDVLAVLNELDRRTLLRTGDDPNRQNARLKKQLEKLKAAAAKVVPGLETLPGAVQAQLILHSAELDPAVLDLIDSHQFGEAALAIVRPLKHTGWLTELADILVEHEALLNTANALRQDNAPDPLLRTTRGEYGRDRYQLRDYAAEMDLQAQLETYDVTLDQLSGTASEQLQAVTRLREAGEHQLAAQAAKVIRLANGVPTKHEMQTGTETPVPIRGDVSMSVAVLDEMDGVNLSMPNMSTRYGADLMQNELKRISRHARLIMHNGHTNRAIIMRSTGGATWLDEKTGKKIRASKESKAYGRVIRSALSYIIEMKGEDWDGNWDDLKDIRVPLFREHIEKLKTRDEDGNLYRITNEAPTLYELVKQYEDWRSKNATHLWSAKSGEELVRTVSRARQVFVRQRELINEAAGSFGEEWVREYAEAGYVPHLYDEDIKKALQKDDVARYEKRRIHPTFIQAALKSGLIPQKQADIAHLLDKYTDIMAMVTRMRAATSAMAMVSDDDLMPMMLLEGPDQQGLITDDIAHALSERIEASVKADDPNHTFKTKRVQSGFTRLNGLIQEIDPQRLGYRTIETGRDGIKSLWVREGVPFQLAKHLFGDQKKFEHEWSRKLFDLTLAFNHYAKSMGIYLSMFHPFALMESLIAISGLEGLDMEGNLLLHPIRTFKEMRSEFRRTISNPEYGREWIEAGLTYDTGKAPDLEYLREHHKVLKLADNWAEGGFLGKAFALPLRRFANAKFTTDRWMWEIMLPAMKLYSANRLFAAEASRLMSGSDEPLDPHRLREDISVYVNDAFGGQEWEQYLWANPRTRKWLNMLMFAPDWTISALNISGVTHVGGLRKALGTPTSKLHARNRTELYWPAFFSIVLVGLPNMLQAMLYSLAKATGNGDDEDKMFSFDNEIHHRFEVDITPFMRTIADLTGNEKLAEWGKTKQRRVYVRWGKQAYEVFEGWLGGPESLRDTLLGKSSVAVKVVQEQIFNQVKPGWNTPWAENGFMESLWDVDGKVWDGRIMGIAKKFIPMSVQPFFDELSSPGKGKPVAFFAPARLGMNSYNAQNEIAEIFRAYVEGGMKANIKGLPRNEDLELLAASVLDAAERNGYDRKKILGQGISKARGFYYLRFFEALENNSERKMNIAAEALITLETKRSQFRQSVENRLNTQGRKPTPEINQTLRDRWNEGMKRAAERKR